MAREIPIISLSRAKILSILKFKEPKTITELAKETGLSRASIYNHLKQLKERNLIKEKQNLKELGQPIYIVTNKADPIALETLKLFEKVFPKLFKK